MANETSQSLQTDVDQWLTSLGFSRGNPFATVEADRERSLLPEFFIHVEGYEVIRRNQTIIVFAPRGAGKSSLRVVLASQAAPIEPEATTLAVEYTDFDPLITKHRAGETLTIEDYVQRLLRAGAKALLNTFCGDPSIEEIGGEKVKKRQSRTRRLTSVTAPARSRLSHLIRSHHPTLLNYEALYERYQALEPTFSPDWFNFTTATIERRLHRMLTHTPLYNDGIANLLADLNDYPDTIPDRTATPTEQLKEFVALTRTVGLTCVQFLVDRLDENPETVNNPQSQADILETLLAHLLVLETSGVAFKFFLAQETRDVLLKRPKIRLDRLINQALTIAWDESQLRHMLKERLAVYSDGQVLDLAQLCEESRVSIGRDQERRSYPLSEWIEGEMVEWAKGSPRRLLIAGQLLCQAHIETSGPTGLLGERDWTNAEIKLRQQTPPPPLLRFHRRKRTVLIGNQEKKLTPLESRIFNALVEANGRCDRNKLSEIGWNSTEGVTDAAIDRAIAGLRKKLGDYPDNPIYLKTERGEGFELMNYEVVE